MSDDPMRIGQVAERAGVSADTIRHYEKLGLIPGVTRSEGGFRSYGPESLRRVLLVRRALVFGFSLAELQGYFTARDRGSAPCRQVRQAAGKKLQAVEEQMRELRAVRDAMRRVMLEWDEALSGASDGAKLHLLDRLPHIEAKHGRALFDTRQLQSGTLRKPKGRSR
jgi:DNA-binding transcriptional MerR regulator